MHFLPMLAQNMPGMECIPIMGLLLVLGHVCGLVALGLRIFGATPRPGIIPGSIAAVLGLGSALLFLLLEGSNLFATTYLILATPAITGGLALAIPPIRASRKLMWRLFGVAIAISVTAIGWYWLDRKVPSGVTVEESVDEAWSGEGDMNNPFDGPPAVDVQNQLFLEAFHSKVRPTAEIAINIPCLKEFSGPDRELLIRHLVTSAKWFVTRDIVEGNEKKIARRRYVQAGLWLDQLNGYFADISEKDSHQYRIVLALDGTAYGQVFHNATIVNLGQKQATLNVTPQSAGSEYNDSYLVVKSPGIAVEIYEQSTRTDRPFTPVALEQLNQELQAVLASNTARARGFDPALMPAESIRRGQPDMHLIHYDEEVGTYQVQAYVNPGESGYVYLKVFEGGGNSEVSADDYFKPQSIEYTGWSTDSQELFFYNTEFEFGEPTIFSKFAARIEIWFVPSSGGAERKLFEKYFNVK
jgi:hypothetical protein